MGTDIHGVFQRYDEETKKWEDVSSKYEEGRHYQLFAALAGVRNGFGFAGCVTGEPVEPIAKGRGLPEDFHVGRGCVHRVSSKDLLNEWRLRYREEDDEGFLDVWMGTTAIVGLIFRSIWIG